MASQLCRQASQLALSLPRVVMMYLGRVVTPGKWVPANGLGLDEMPADLLTGKASLLRTSDNTLSFWYSAESPSDATRTTALAYASSCERLDSIAVVWLASDVLAAAGLDLVPSNGVTPILDLVRRHLDACRLDARRLSLLASHLWQAVVVQGQIEVFTLDDVRQLLGGAISQGRLSPAHLKAALKSDLPGGKT